MELIEVVESIGRLKDKAEYDKWVLAEAVYDAYQELPNYEKGLTSGLCERLNYTTTQVYNLKHAQEILNRTRFLNTLSVSHYARLYRLQKEFELSDENVLEYLELAHEENWSVSKLAQEVNNNHAEQNHKEERLFKSLLKNMRSYWQTEHITRFSKETRAIFYDLMREMEDENETY